MNILKMTITFPALLSMGVIPVLNPTVPKALISSKIRSKIPRSGMSKMDDSVMVNRKIAMVFPAKKKSKTLYALDRKISGMVRWNNWT